MTEPFFPEKFILAIILAKRAQNGPKIVFFGFFENFVILVFLGNNLKRKLTLLLIFHHHIQQNSRSQVIGENAVSQSNWRVL